MARDVEDGSAPTFLGIPMKWLSLLLLIAQTVCVVNATRLAKSSRYLKTTAVFLTETLKLCCSFFALCHELGSVGAACRCLSEHVLDKPWEVAWVSVLALLYVLQNQLMLIGMSNLSGAVYQVTYQLKILPTAVLSWLILDKSLDPPRCVALLMLTCGVALMFMRRGADVHATGKGYVAVLSACVTSGLAGVYQEKILKQSGTSFWLSNVQLYICGSVLGLLVALLQDRAKIRERGFLQGYDRLVWLVVCLQAFGGLATAAVLKHADNLLKCFGNALAICIQAGLSALLFEDFDLNGFSVVGTLLVLAASYLYGIGPPKLAWLAWSYRPGRSMVPPWALLVFPRLAGLHRVRRWGRIPRLGNLPRVQLAVLRP